MVCLVGTSGEKTPAGRRLKSLEGSVITTGFGFPRERLRSSAGERNGLDFPASPVVTAN